MKFSIIIPVYNVAQYLRVCLDAVVGQDYQDWEAVCIDDGSTDGSGSILDEYASEDSRFVVVHQKNGGVSRARNAGLIAAKGKWITFVDPDDIPATWLLSEYEKMISSYKPDIVRVACERFSCSLPNRSCDEKSEIVVVEGEQKRLEYFWSVVANLPEVWSSAFRRDVLGDLNFEEGCNFGEDKLLQLKIWNKISNAACSNRISYFYRQRIDGLSRIKKKDPIERVRYYEVFRPLIDDDYSRADDTIKDLVITGLRAFLLETLYCVMFDSLKVERNSVAVNMVRGFLQSNELSCCCNGIKWLPAMWIFKITGIAWPLRVTHYLAYNRPWKNGN